MNTRVDDAFLEMLERERRILQVEQLAQVTVHQLEVGPTICASICASICVAVGVAVGVAACFSTCLPPLLHLLLLRSFGLLFISALFTGNASNRTSIRDAVAPTEAQ